MLDPARARAEADAAERRGAGTLWGAGPVAWEGVSAGIVVQAEVVPSVDEPGSGRSEGAPEAGVATLRKRVAPPVPAAEPVSTALLTAILARLEIVAPRLAEEGLPSWLAEAIGNPLAYDAASSHRIDVCARVDPALYRRLQAMKERIGLRTTAGAWEYVLRVGLATGARESRCAADGNPLDGADGYPRRKNENPP